MSSSAEDTGCIHRRDFLGMAAGSAALGALGTLIGAAPASAADIAGSSTSLGFAVVSDTHANVAESQRQQSIAKVFASIAQRDPAFVLHCGDVTDTGLPDEYDLFAQALPASLQGKIHYTPGNHEVRWDSTTKELVRSHFGPAPYSFDAGGLHFVGFDPTQLVQEPGHYGDELLDWLDRDLDQVRGHRPTLLFQHYPMGQDFFYVDDQDRFFDLIADRNVRVILAGHIHRDSVSELNGLTQVAFDAVRNGPMYYWVAATSDALAVTRVDVAADGTTTSRAAATVGLAGDGPGTGVRPTVIDFGAVVAGSLPVDVTLPAKAVPSEVAVQVWPQQVYAVTSVQPWTPLAMAPDGHWRGSADVSTLAPGAGRLRVRATATDATWWETRRNFTVPGVAGTPTPLWKVKLPGSVQGALASFGNTVVAASTAGHVVALRVDGRDVSTLWRRNAGPAYRGPAFSVDGNVVFVPSTDHQVYALDTADGKPLWTFQATAPVLSPPLVTPINGRSGVLVSAGDTLVALDATTGSPMWTANTGGFSAGRVASDGDRVYRGGGDGFVRALDAATGTQIWARRLVTGSENHILLNAPWDNTVLSAGGVVVVTSVTNAWGLDPATGTQKWVRSGGYMYPPPLALQGDPASALIITEFGVAFRVVLATGATQWTSPLGIRIFNSGAALQDERAWVQSADGQLIGLDLGTGTIQSRLQHTVVYSYSTPAVVDDVLVAADQDGVLRGIQLT